MNLNIRELISGGPTRLRYVWRFSTSRVQHPESVAEHSYYVALYCMMIADWASVTQKMVIRFDLLNSRALVHDLEEARSGDFPRLFKHSDPTLKNDLNNASRKAFLQLISKVVHPSNLYEAYWRDSKCQDPEGAILEFADFLAVLGFMMQECEGGNRTIKNHVLDMKEYFDTFKSAKFNFIAPLVSQAEVLMKETFPDEYKR